MIRRLIVIGSVGLALAGGAKLALVEVTERAWERRREELLGLALFPATERRPWEVRFESLAQRLATSARVDEIEGSPYVPHVAFGEGAPRALDDFERVWVESLWGELVGLDGVLAELRKLPLDALEWHGEARRLSELRVAVRALCARAWLAAEDGDSEGAARAYGDALRLSRATCDGTTIGVLVRNEADGIALRSLRSALALGPSPRVLRAELEPLLLGLAHDPEDARGVIRRELAVVSALEGPDEPADALREFAQVERALELAGEPVEAVARLHRRAEDQPVAADAALWRLGASVSWSHARHAQRNVALTALAVAEHRERNGAFPATLAELALPAEQTLDPLRGAPLPYSLGESGARVGPAAWGERVEAGEELEDSLYAWTVR